jgi:hypothetical protein
LGTWYSDGNETLTSSPTVNLIVAPESDSTRVREPVYVGVGEGFTGLGVTTTAGLADAVPATDAEAAGVLEGDVVPAVPPASVDAAHPQQRRRPPAAIRLNKLMFLRRRSILRGSV